MQKTHTSALAPRRATLARLAAAIVVGVVVVSVQARASERWATLEAIHQLENPRDTDAPGSCGELGAYQFREQTWKMHTEAPFSRALDRRSSDAVAVKHYDWIKSQLEAKGVAATPFNIALAWNGGIKAVFDPHPPAVAVDYASRAANIASVLEKSQLAYSH